MPTPAAAATKQDLDDLYVRMEKMVGNTVGEIVGEALQMVSDRFDQVDRRFDRLENKLDDVAATVDHHTIDIRELQRKTA